MKKQLLLLVMMMLPLVASADAVEVDGIYYNLISKAHTAEVTRLYNSYKGDIVIPESIVYDNEKYDVTAIGKQAFFYCSDLTSITIPQSITIIREAAFISCTALKTIRIPSSIKKIDFSAFQGCTNLTSVHITDLEAWCNIDFGGDNGNPLSVAGHLFINDEEIKELYIPNSIQSIKDYAFEGNLGITLVNIPNSVVSIGVCAFKGCVFSSLEIPNSVTSIGDGAFSGCSNLEQIVIPNSVTELGRWVFNGCSKLRSVKIPETNSIGQQMFGNCSSLESLEIPSSVLSIGRMAFFGCAALTHILIPNNVTYIDEQAFENCTSLTTVIIGSSVNKIKNYSFKNCPKLADIYCYAKTPPVAYGSIFFDSYIEYAKLYVPSGSLELYKSTEPWKDFGTIVELKEDDPGYTGINVVETTRNSNTTIYDLNGVRQPEPKKGINIVNGKKIIMK